MIDLLMRRREMVAAKKQPFVNPYITDGLIFQLDGIEKGDDVTSWTDLIGNVELKGTGVRGANCYTFTNNQLLSAEVSFASSDSYTVEVCYHSNKGDNAIFGVGNGASGFPAWVRRSNKVVFIHRKSTYVANKYDYVTASANLARAYENGVQMSFAASDYWVTAPVGTIYVGRAVSGSAVGWPFYGDLYAIRIYNRQLTEEEILHNQAIDNTRFNLGLTINS